MTSKVYRECVGLSNDRVLFACHQSVHLKTTRKTDPYLMVIGLVDSVGDLLSEMKKLFSEEKEPAVATYVNQ